MVDWVAQGATWLEIIYREMFKRLLAGNYLQADESPVRCRDPDADGKTVQGWLCVLSRPKGEVVFHWRMSREHAHGRELLSNFPGLLPTALQGMKRSPREIRKSITSDALLTPGYFLLGHWMNRHSGQALS